MAKLAIDDGFVDCPKYGVIDVLRCLPSCEFQGSKDEDQVTCHFGEEPPSKPAGEEVEAAPEKV
jgi:hypothetical protein